jgi:23S rRNA (pseudouridine1915-N3)-methyltransferase
MIIRVLAIGQTKMSYVKDGLDLYLKRLTHYTRVEWIELPDPSSKSAAPEQQRVLEGELLLKNIQPGDFVVLLDEKGKLFSSAQWAEWMNKRQLSGSRSLVLIIGGAYGFSDAVRQRTDQMISLSPMTFPHDLVRVILAEQLYRCFTILKGEKYHHV